ncbi:MAG: SGNH/GDSL hydrolase family protein [Deltaproteobacteria bacterium]|nr:SGNH/GDSL hydrolase family protein [Deltaproteobacteria bacterium]
MRFAGWAVCAVLLGCSGGDDAGDRPIDDAGDGAPVVPDAAADSPEPDGSPTDTSPAEAAVDAGPPAVRLVGRFTDKNESAWSGTHMIARFEGTGARLKLTAPANARFQVVVDGEPKSVLVPTGGSKTYTVASGLASGVHELVVWRRSEAFFGVVTYEGFEFDGALLPPAPPPARRVEIVGDSITCGYGNEDTEPCPFSAATENHYLTYGAIAARAVKADLVTTCWSGLGMYRNYDATTAGAMPERWLRTLPQTTGSTWDFSRYVPHVVVINLGTNDFAKGDPGTAFRTAYLAFARTVRKAYPDAHLLAIVPVAGAKKYIDAVVATLVGEGDKKIASFSLSAIASSDGWGCDYHPSLATHAKWGAELATQLVAKLGW